MCRQRPKPMACTELQLTRCAMRAQAERRCAHHAGARDIAQAGNAHRGVRAWLRELA